MKITHHFGKFSTFFKESSLFVQSLIIVTGIGIIAGTATVAAMVVSPTDSETQITTSGEVESSIAGNAQTEDSQLATDDAQQDTSTDLPQSSQSNTQTNTTQNTSEPTTPQQAQPEPQPEPTYTDTYPSKWASKPIDSAIDDWGMNNRQSVSYTAWKVNEKYGNMPYFGGCNASQWVQCAENKNIPTGTAAKAHSVGIVNNFSVWVEAVNGNKVTVSFYNWGNTGAYGLWKDVPASNFSNYIYFGN